MIISKTPLKMEMLPTDCPPIDELLGGGLEKDAITQVFGEGGCGKTNLCLQVAKSCILRGSKVVFIDTEGISTQRIEQVFGANYKEMCEKILLFEPYDMKEQTEAIENLIELLNSNKYIGLVVIDSATVYYRMGMGGDSEAEDRRNLALQMTSLLSAARKYKIPILVTNQVYTRQEDHSFQPIGGHLFSHYCKTILRLDKLDNGVRRMVVTKHRSIPEDSQAKFLIAEEGLVEEPVSRE